jgi:hypothetical protein
LLAHPHRLKGTSASLAQLQLTTAAPPRPTSGPSAAEITCAAAGESDTPGCAHGWREAVESSPSARAASRAHPASAQTQLARQAQAAKLAARVSPHIRLVQLRATE